LCFNEELGGEEGFKAFHHAASSLGFGIILDLVANHMAASSQNPWWYDVLEKGPHSPYASYFDIDWKCGVQILFHKILIPILDLPSKEALIQGKIQLVSEGDKLLIKAMGQLFPLSRESYALVSQEGIQELNHNKEKLQQLLEQQYFFLEFWQYASQNINYRRFFDINGLVALKMDQQKAFDDYHKLTLKLLTDGKVQGIRIDHPDGLYEPYHYFKHLHEALAKTSSISLYMVVEKILEREETIPQKWPVDGSVGYEYLNLLNQIFLDPNQEDSFTALYHEFIEAPEDREFLLHKEKRNIALLHLPSEMTRMASMLFQSQKKEKGFSQEELQEAIIELYVFFPVYRTYLERGIPLLTTEEKEALFEAFDGARRSKPYLEKSFSFLKEVFFQERELESCEWDFIMRFQQLGPTIMAKGFEDTHLYNYNRFIGLNEVGSSPHHFGETLETFHERMLNNQQTFPYGWVTQATHDTKRSYEMRCRLQVLTEAFDEWKTQVLLWKKDNQIYKHTHFPDCNREYFLYQTLVGFWPTHIKNTQEKKHLIQRVKDYLIKASRESKAYTTWIHPHPHYENALLSFIDHILEENSSFYSSLIQFIKKIEMAAQWSSISCLNLMLGLPAPLDIYQGTELEDFSLVDPDNRRSVDYEIRKKLLKEIEKILASNTQKAWIESLLKKKELEPLKLYLLKIGFALRKKEKKLFLEGEYIPLQCEGEKKDHVIAYLRQKENTTTLTLSSRWLYQYHSIDFWGNTVVYLPKEFSFIDIYTQHVFQASKTLSIKEALSCLPFGFFLAR
jgi:(1->4)-alpha-D-glucan 1-alpha-D-glucosylmutase